MLADFAKPFLTTPLFSDKKQTITLALFPTITMLRLLCIALSLFLSLQLAVADPASTVDRISRHSKSSSQVLTKSVISALLVRRGKFGARAGDSGGCPSGYQQCTNYPDACAPTGSYCCNDLYNCPNDTTCFGSECCPKTAQTCGGNACCDSGSSCCNDDSCCEPGLFCCNDSTGGCCPTGTTCIAETYQCYTGGSGGGSGSGTGTGGGSGGTSVTPTAAAPSKSTVLPGTTSTNVITFTPSTTGSSSSHSVTSSTVSSSGSTSSGITNIGAAPRGIALAPGKQLAALAAVLCLPILHNVAQAL